MLGIKKQRMVVTLGTPYVFDPESFAVAPS